MFCPKCGGTIPDGYKICMKCGFNIDEISDDGKAQPQIQGVQINEQPTVEKKEKKKKNHSLILIIALLLLIAAGGYVFFAHRELLPFGKKEAINKVWTFDYVEVSGNKSFKVNASDFKEASSIPAFSVSDGNRFTLKINKEDVYTGVWENSTSDSEGFLGRYILNLDESNKNFGGLKFPAGVFKSSSKDEVLLMIVLAASGSDDSITYVFSAPE